MFQPLPIEPIAVFSVCERVSTGVVKYLSSSASTRNDSSANAGADAPFTYHSVSVNSATDSPMSDSGPSYSCCVTVIPPTGDRPALEMSDSAEAPGNCLISAATVVGVVVASCLVECDSTRLPGVMSDSSLVSLFLPEPDTSVQYDSSSSA